MNSIKILTAAFPNRRDEILQFCRRHHYTHRSPGVWSVAYVIENARGKIMAVSMYGPPPYPSISRAFVRDPAHAARLIWQSRMAGAGISAAQLDALIQHANADLATRGYWYVYTMTDPHARVVEGLQGWMSPGFTGGVYSRNGFTYLGYAGRAQREGWLVDGKVFHIRQGTVTLTKANIRQRFPEAREIREITGFPKQRWVYVLGNERERAQRILLMKLHPQVWEPVRQPRLLSHRSAGWVLGPALG